MAATFDDGLLTVYSVQNTGDNGSMPVESLVEKGSYYFGFETLGITRYYTALSNKEMIESVVHIYQDRGILVNDVVKLVDTGVQYRVKLCQHVLDDDGIPISRLSIERIDGGQNGLAE